MHAQAIALGASAVLLGRPVLYGLTLGGQAGVERVLSLLRNEVELSMALAGCTSLADLTPDILRMSAACGGCAACTTCGSAGGGVGMGAVQVVGSAAAGVCVIERQVCSGSELGMGEKVFGGSIRRDARANQIMSKL